MAHQFSYGAETQATKQATPTYLDPEIAYRVSQVMAEKRRVIENQYRWMPIKHSPMIYPIDVKAMFETPGVEYHEGALRYYADSKQSQKAA